jgi:hypothetical protein
LRELIACGVALATLLARPGPAETGVGGVGIGVERVGVEEAGVEPVRGGIVVGEPSEGGEPEQGGTIGGVLLNAGRPAHADQGDAVSLDGMDRLAYHDSGGLRGVDAGEDGSGESDDEERCDHEHLGRRSPIIRLPGATGNG